MYRKAVVQIGVKTTGEDDAQAKKQMADLATALATVKPALNRSSQANSAANAALEAVFNDMRALYPSTGSFAPSLDSLGERTEAMFAHESYDESKGNLENVLSTKVNEKLTSVRTQVDLRAHLREEVSHYEEKLGRISTGAVDPAAIKRVEENKVKLKDHQDKFTACKDALEPVLASLDSDLAGLLQEPVKKFVEVNAKDASTQAAEIRNGLNAVPVA
jgi:hypothetical protein